MDTTKKNLEVREKLTTGIYIENLTEIPAKNLDEAMEYLYKPANQFLGT
jgi:hypothetical protein